MPKQRVLHIYQDFYPKRGGIEDHILHLASFPSERYTHSVLVSATGMTTQRQKIRGIDVVHAASWGRYYTPFCPTMPYWIKKLAPDLLHLHHPCPMAFLAAMLVRQPIPIVVGYHNDVVKPRALIRAFDLFQRIVLRRASAILVGTESYRQASPFLASFQPKCHVAPYGIPLDQFVSTAERDEQSAQIRQQYPGPLLLFVGRLCYYKGLDIALKAMAKVNGTLLIVGTGPLLADVRQQIQDHQLQGKVFLVGPVDDATLAAYYDACDMLILPSVYSSEAFGLVMLQAQACKRPVICSDLPGMSTVNVANETGLLVPPGDADALAQAIIRLCEKPELGRQMGEAGWKQVEEKYRIELMVSRIEEVYNQISTIHPTSRSSEA